VVRDVRIGSCVVGDGRPPLFLGEIGALFNRDLALAETLIDRVAAVARDSQVLPVMLKGEILHDPDICLDDDTVETFQSKSGNRRQERYRALIERKCVSLDDYARLIAHARGAGLELVMSVYDFAGADFAKDQGIVAIKIASSNVTHLPLIRHCAGLGIPLIIDDGRASLAEIDRAVRVARDAGCDDLVLQHSPDGHPAPPGNHNLRSLRTLSGTFGVPNGLSDHHSGTDMLTLAIGLGTHLIEKNVVGDDQALEQDYAISAGVDDLAGLIGRLEACWLALGDRWRDVNNTEGLIATSARMGLVTRRQVAAGETMSPETVGFAFPARGIRVEDFDRVQGWRFRAALDAGSVIGWGDVDA